MDDIYTQNIIEHAKNPHHKGILSAATISQKANNPSCGDALTLFLDIEESGEVKDASFEGYGCAISTAATSLLLDHIIGKSIEELRLLAPGDIYTMLGIDISPGRTQCALLAYGALADALKRYEHE